MKQLNFLNDLVECFEKLPGVGHKTALRYAYYIVEKYDLDDIVYKRVKHVVTECDRVLKAVFAMKDNDINALGKLLVASHNSLKNDYEVTGIELDTLVDLALQHEACIGSRMTGAGFGGCTISLVLKSKVEEFKEYVMNYLTKFGENDEPDDWQKFKFNNQWYVYGDMGAVLDGFVELVIEPLTKDNCYDLEFDAWEKEIVQGSYKPLQFNNVCPLAIQKSLAEYAQSLVVAGISVQRF